MLIGKPIEYPPPAFNPGDRVRFIKPEDFEEGGSHYVVASNHTHTQLEGFKYATANWRLRRVHKARQKSTEEPPRRDREERVKIPQNNATSSGKPLRDTRP